MTNPFDWRKFTDEERAARGETRNEGNTSRKRSLATTKSLERIRETKPTYGTVHGMSAKSALMVALKPRTFTIYSKVQPKSNGEDTT